MMTSTLPARIRSMPRRRRKRAVLPWVEQEITRSVKAAGFARSMTVPAVRLDVPGIEVLHVTLSPALNQAIAAHIARGKAQHLAKWGAR